MLAKLHQAAVLVVVYPGIDDFFRETLASLRAQTTEEFDILLFADALPDAEQRWDLDGLHARIIHLPEGLSIAENRTHAIRWALHQHYKFLILADADDLLGPNRVQESCAALESGASPVVYNTCTVHGTDEDLFGGALPPTLTSPGDLSDHNCIGFSTAALQLPALKDSLEAMPIFHDLIAFDWYFFAFLLHQGHAFRRLENVYTRYRLHAGNTAGGHSLTPARLEHGILVKETHYRHLAGLYPQYLARHSSLLAFAERMKQGGAAEYVRQANSMSFHFWWENINHPNIAPR